MQLKGVAVRISIPYIILTNNKKLDLCDSEDILKELDHKLINNDLMNFAKRAVSGTHLLHNLDMKANLYKVLCECSIKIKFRTDRYR